MLELTDPHQYKKKKVIAWRVYSDPEDIVKHCEQSAAAEILAVSIVIQ